MVSATKFRQRSNISYSWTAIQILRDLVYCFSIQNTRANYILRLLSYNQKIRYSCGITATYPLCTIHEILTFTTCHTIWIISRTAQYLAPNFRSTYLDPSSMPRKLVFECFHTNWKPIPEDDTTSSHLWGAFFVTY